MHSFQQKVYNMVKTIPMGKVATYASIAARIKKHRAFRAVGSALGKNRSPEVPCHRVVRSDFAIGGYAGGPKKKMEILKKEGIIISRGKVNKKSLWR